LSLDLKKLADLAISVSAILLGEPNHRWSHSAGNCFLILRYGNKVISPTPDKGAIAVGDKAKLPEILEAVITATRAGELDAVMAAAKAVDPARGIKRKAA